MIDRKNFALLSAAVLLALLAATVMPLAAFAQDTTPPPTDVPVVEDPPVDEAPPVDAPVVDVPAVDAPPAEELTVPEILEQLPEGTDLIVADANGDVLPLASEEAAQVLSFGDPYFMDGGVKYSLMPIGGCAAIPLNCTESATPIQAAVDAFKNSTATGNITVEAGSYTENVTIAGNLGNLSNLTGLIGAAGSGSTTLTGNVSVMNMTNAFTFQGFTLIGSFNAANNSGDVTVSDVAQNGAAGDGISVTTSGNITLTNVTASENSSGGATLNNMFGTGSVTLTGTNVFNDNKGGTGLSVESTGDISASNITASRNKVSGATLNNMAGTGSVTLTGTNVFNDNKVGWGLVVVSTGDISASNITANGNSTGGAYLGNTSGTGSVTLTGTNVFNDEKVGSGLVVVSTGDISASNVTASGNNGIGAYLYTNNTSGVSVITLSGANVFSGNTAKGLRVGSGNVTLNNAAINNSTAGIQNFVGAGYTLTLNCVTFSGNDIDISDTSNVVDNGCGGTTGGGANNGSTGGSDETGNNGNTQPITPVIIAITAPYGESDLPGGLTGGSFVGGLNVTLSLNGEAVDEAPDGVEVTFTIPEDMLGKTFNVLFWDGTQWVTIAVNVTGNQAKFIVHKPGKYVLVVVP